MNLNTKKLHSLLRKVSLGGLIVDCFLQMEGLNGKMTALDSTRTIFVQSEGKIGDDKSCNEVLSLREIGKLCKFIGDIKEKEDYIEAEIKDNRLCLSSKTKGSVKFLLGEVEKGQQDKADKGINEILKVVKNKKELKEERIDEVLYFVNLFSCEELLFKVKNGKMSIESLEDSIQIFSVSMGKEDKEDLILRFNAQFFKAVMSEIDWESKDAPVILYEKDSPIVFQQGKSAWILALIS